jgi:hypothetical protein
MSIFYYLKTERIPIKIASKITITKGIHNGDSTHHHDQSIFPVNFRTINKIARTPQIPIPCEPPLDESDMFISFLSLIIMSLKRLSINKSLPHF